MSKLPTISVLIPTLNSVNFLEKCLQSIFQQNYPKDKLEVIIADGGSKDGTLAIAEKYKANIYYNPLKTGEAGKVVALKHAQNDLVALIDSDNLLPDKNWLKRMVVPFSDSQIIGSEPWEYTYRREDGFIDRYCALLGMNDPLCLFLGNYDRVSRLTDKWTGIKLCQEDRGDWIKVTLESEILPTIGANGTLIRREILTKSRVIGEYLVDIDVIADLASRAPVQFAKVKTGIVHLFCGRSINKFIRKQRRRVKDYMHYRQKKLRKYPWQEQNRLGLLKFILACLTIIPLLWQSLKGYFKKPDPAWFFHPFSCWLTLWIYTIGVVESVFGAKQMTRNNWQQ